MQRLLLTLKQARSVHIECRAWDKRRVEIRCSVKQTKVNGCSTQRSVSVPSTIFANWEGEESETRRCDPKDLKIEKNNQTVEENACKSEHQWIINRKKARLIVKRASMLVDAVLPLSTSKPSPTISLVLSLWSGVVGKSQLIDTQVKSACSKSYGRSDNKSRLKSRYPLDHQLPVDM